MQIRLSKLNNVLADYYSGSSTHWDSIEGILPFDEEYVYNCLNKMLPREYDETLLCDALADIFEVPKKDVKVDSLYIKTNINFHDGESSINIRIDNNKQGYTVVLELLFDDMTFLEYFK